MREEGIPAEETSLTVEEVLHAQEIFLTNAGYGIRWVKRCGKSEYGKVFADILYKKFVASLYNS